METQFHLKFKDHILGTLYCFDRILLKGSLTEWGNKYKLESFFLSKKIMLKDFTIFAASFREQLIAHITDYANKNNIKIEHIRSPKRFDKEANIQKIIEQNNPKHGVIHIYSAMEICDSFTFCYDSKNRKAFLKPKTTSCLHYYIYLLDKEFGLCHLRIPTYLPFRLQFVFNGHNYLSSKLNKARIKHHMDDNSFDDLSNFIKANKLSSAFRVEDLHKFLNVLTERFIPFLKPTNQSYRWTIAQAEFSTDILFSDPKQLVSIYEQLSRNCIHSVKPNNITTFFSRKLTARLKQDVGNSFNTTIQGSRIKHRMGVNTIKMYNKGTNILRIETTVNDITQFRVYRDVLTRNGQKVKKWANMKKSIYSLYQLAKLCRSANNRYLDFIAPFDDYSDGINNLDKLSKKVNHNDRSYKGFNFFDPDDSKVLLALCSGELNINGFRNKTLRCLLKHSLSSSKISRILKRLHLHRLIKKVKNTYKYYVTQFGKTVLATAHMIKELKIIPALAM